MNKRFHIMMTLGFIVYIGGFFGLQIVAQDKDFSELENRNLAKRPEWTIESFFNGKFGKDYETYIADQFPGRDQFIAIKSNTERFIQKTDNNGVYIGKDGYFMQEFDTPDLALLEKNIGYINQFAENFNVSMMLVPTATKVHEDKLPSFATPYDEAKYIEMLKEGIEDQVNWVDALGSLSAHKDEYIYYKTDHHWTTLGAYYGYEAFCESLDIDPLKLEDFNRVVGSEDFYGSLFSKGNFTFATPDTLELFVPKEEKPLSVYYMGSDKLDDSLYELGHLEKKDKYSVFLDNNHPVIQIKTEVDNGKKIVVVKDSYANAFIPYLTQHFEEVHVLDMRFLNMKISSYLKEQGIEDVLMLYNVQNFSTMNKFSLLGGE